MTLFSVNANADRKNHWITINYPPAYIIYGPDNHTGINDVAMQMMVKNLDSFSHEIIENITIPRMLNFFRSKETFCSPGLAVIKRLLDFLPIEIREKYRKINMKLMGVKTP